MTARIEALLAESKTTGSAAPGSTGDEASQVRSGSDAAGPISPLFQLIAVLAAVVFAYVAKLIVQQAQTS